MPPVVLSHNTLCRKILNRHIPNEHFVLFFLLRTSHSPAPRHNVGVEEPPVDDAVLGVQGGGLLRIPHGDPARQELRGCVGRRGTIRRGVGGGCLYLGQVSEI